MKRFSYLAILNASLLAASLISFTPAAFDFDYKLPGDPGKNLYQNYSGPIRIFFRRVHWRTQDASNLSGWRATQWDEIQDGDTVLVMDYDTRSLIGIEQWTIRKRGVITVELIDRRIIMERGDLQDGVGKVVSLLHGDAMGLRAGAR